MKVIKESLERAALSAARLLKNGGVVICPTDTVYGFLADATNKKAVEKMYKIKKRPKSKPLSVFVKDLKMARQIALIDEKRAGVLEKYWPGRYTFVLKLKVIKLSSYKVYGVGKDSVAIRIPKHAFLQKLFKKLNRPLVQTSVNISAQEPLNSPEQIMTIFKKSRLVGLIIDGGSIKSAKPSKIIDLSKEKVVRLR